MLKNIELIAIPVIVGSAIIWTFLKWLKHKKRFIKQTTEGTPKTTYVPPTYKKEYNITDEYKVKYPTISESKIKEILTKFDKMIDYAFKTKDLKKLPSIMTLPTFRKLEQIILSNSKGNAIGLESHKICSWNILDEIYKKGMRILKIVRYREKKMGMTKMPMGIPQREKWTVYQIAYTDELIIGGIDFER